MDLCEILNIRSKRLVKYFNEASELNKYIPVLLWTGCIFLHFVLDFICNLIVVDFSCILIICNFTMFSSPFGKTYSHLERLAISVCLLLSSWGLIIDLIAR